MRAHELRIKPTIATPRYEDTRNKPELTDTRVIALRKYKAGNEPLDPFCIGTIVYGIRTQLYMHMTPSLYGLLDQSRSTPR